MHKRFLHAFKAQSLLIFTYSPFMYWHSMFKLRSFSKDFKLDSEFQVDILAHNVPLQNSSNPSTMAAVRSKIWLFRTFLFIWAHLLQSENVLYHQCSRFSHALKNNYQSTVDSRFWIMTSLLCFVIFTILISFVCTFAFVHFKKLFSKYI